MKMTGRFLGFLGTLLLLAGPAGAQTYPDKPVHVLVGFAAGGPVDLTARHFTSVLSERLGQPVVVESRPGAGGSVAANEVKRAAPDGYTLYYGPLSGVNPVLMKTGGVVGGDDLAPVSNLMVHSYVYLVRADLPVKDFDGLLAYSKEKQKDGGVLFGQAGVPSWLVTRLLADRTGLIFTPVPYNGQARTIEAMLTGEIDMATAANVPQALVDEGKIRPLFVSRRMAAFPNISSVAELGVKDFEVGFYYGLWAPLGTPQPIIDKLAAEIGSIMQLPEVVKQFRESAAGDAIGSTPQDQLTQYRGEIDFLTRAAQAANFTPE